MIWLQFITCGALLTFFAYHLSKEGIILSEKTHLEEGVIGMVFLAIATSFPEIVTSATAVFSFDRVALGYGDLIGSVIVNFMVLTFLDIYIGRGRILLRVDRSNRLTGDLILAAAIILLAAFALRTYGPGVPSIGGVGLESVLLVIMYASYLFVIHRKGPATHESLYRDEKSSFLSLWAKFISLLLVVMGLGMWMARIGDRIVAMTELSQNFTGTLLLGFATSLPEIIVSFAALKAGSADMAVGNILGSNLFDICIVPLLDLLTDTPLMSGITPGGITATAIVLALSVIAVMGMKIKKDAGRRLSWDTALIFAIGLTGFVILYYIN